MKAKCHWVSEKSKKLTDSAKFGQLMLAEHDCWLLLPSNNLCSWVILFLLLDNQPSCKRISLIPKPSQCMWEKFGRCGRSGDIIRCMVTYYTHPLTQSRTLAMGKTKCRALKVWICRAECPNPELIVSQHRTIWEILSKLSKGQLVWQSLKV